MAYTVTILVSVEICSFFPFVLILTVAMAPTLLSVAFLSLLLGSLFQVQSPVSQNQIASPAAGDIIRGVVPVMGTADGSGFFSYDLEYAFSGSENANWFPITHSSQSVIEAALGTWDTTVITDGDYSIRLRVTYQDGSQELILVEHVMVRNYINPADGVQEAVSPAGIALEEQDLTNGEPTRTASTNPASLQVEELNRVIQWGAVTGVGFVLLIGIYEWLRSLTRH
jgi:hypothetical protein